MTFQSAKTAVLANEVNMREKNIMIWTAEKARWEATKEEYGADQPQAYIEFHIVEPDFHASEETNSTSQEASGIQTGHSPRKRSLRIRIHQETMKSNTRLSEGSETIRYSQLTQVGGNEVA